MIFLSIDIGSSTCRAALVSDGGEVRSIVRHPMEYCRKHTPYVEIDCDHAWSVVKTVVARLLAENQETDIAAIGVSAMLGYVPLGQDHLPLGPAILYADNRAVQQVDDMLRIVSGPEIHRITGRRATPELLAPKLLWFKTHQPDYYNRIRTVIGLKDEMVRRLTGVVATDMAHANYSLLFDVGQGRYDRDLVRAVGLEADKLPPEPVFGDQVVGTVCAPAAGELGIKAGTPVVAGSSDGTTAMYGGGLHESNKAVLVAGSTDVLMMPSGRYPRDRSMSLSINTGPDASTLLVGGATGYSGAALQRFEILMNRPFDSIAADLDQVPPGSEGLVVLPGLGGERAPYWRSGARGAMHGLTLAHGPEHLFRALIEGTSYRIRRLLLALADAGLRAEAVKVVGGLGASQWINRIRADVTGVSMCPLAQLEATCVGTAMFCKSGLEGGGALLEISRSWSLPLEAIAPDLNKTVLYDRLAGSFEAYLSHDRTNGHAN
jgi:xylulokinase